MELVQKKGLGMTKDDNLSAVDKVDYETQTRIKALVEVCC